MKKVAPKRVSGRVVKTVTWVAGPGRENGDLGGRPVIALFERRYGKDHVCSRGFANPIPLHRHDPIGPGFQLVKVLQQALGVVGDAEEPLRQFLGLNSRVTPFAGAVDHLLVGKNGLARGAPVDRRFLLEGQSFLVQLQKQPLRPLVVFGTAGCDLAAPIDRYSQAAELAVDRRYGFLGELGGWLAGLYGHVLGVEAEGVVAHGMEHAAALMPVKPGYHVAHRVVLDVAHMRAARGVREHLEDVGGILALAWTGRSLLRIRDDERTLVGPYTLPLGFDLFRVVLARHPQSFRRLNTSPRCSVHFRPPIIPARATGNQIFLPQAVLIPSMFACP